MPTDSMRATADLLLRAGVPLVYLGFLGLTVLALQLARWAKARGNVQLQSSLLSPLGSLYTLTTAFLLSNVLFMLTNLRTVVTQEVVTINKLGAVLAVLPEIQRVEGRRLLYDYVESIARDEAQANRYAERSEVTQEKLDRLEDFLGTTDASPPPGVPETPISSNYYKKAADFGFDLIDARERRLALARDNFPQGLWLAIAVMFFALALLAFFVHSNGLATLWAAIILLIAAPVPAILLSIYNNSIAHGLINIARSMEQVLERNL